ncbi:MAG: extracellular solute-binding protein, partial [Spirochaetota bacterium]
MRYKATVIMMIITLAVLAPLFGAGQQDGAAADTGEAPSAQAVPVELRLLVPQSPGVPEGVKAVADKYMALNPSVTVTIRSVPFNRYKEQLQVMWSSSDVDDVVIIGSPDIVNYAYYGALLPLDDILPPQERSQFIQSAINAVSYEGKLYAYPFREAASAMFYNKQFFAMAGVEAPPLEKPWTWPQWLDNVTKIRAAVNKATGKDVWGINFLSNPGRGDFWLTPIIRSAGSKDSPTYRAVSADGMTLSGYADTPEALGAYRFYQSLYTTHKLAPSAEVPDAFGTGQSITTISFLATANELRKNFPDLEWGLMPLPYFKTPLTHTGDFTYAVSNKSKAGMAAKAFVRFAGSDEGILAYFGASGSNMVSRIGFSDRHPEYYAEEHQKFFSRILETYGEARPATPGYVL